jgi:hypothetical protein
MINRICTAARRPALKVPKPKEIAKHHSRGGRAARRKRSRR